MSIYTVHEPPLRTGETLPDPERFAFVRDGFYLWAFLLTPLWLLRHWLWQMFLLYVAIAVVVEGVLYYLGAGDAGVTIAMLFVSLLFGLEAGTLQRFTLTLRGWRNVGVVGGNELEVAERRFFATWVGTATRGGPRAATPTSVATPLPASRQPAVVGLFPESGARS
jgi:Protein of unknown function (DUF2628)